MKKERLTVWLPTDMAARIRQAAKDESRTLSVFVERAIGPLVQGRPVASAKNGK
jgi:uncharacterized protein (DUF1778 family)